MAKPKQPTPPAAPTSVKVVSPEGELGAIPSGQLADATEQGFRLLTPEVQAEIDRKAKYDNAGGYAATALTGAARGVSLGLSDVALAGSGLVEASTLKDLRDENPTLSTASEIAGTLVPIVGELGLGAKVGGEALGGAGRVVDAVAKASPAGLTTKLGGVVERSVSEALGERLAAKLAGATLRGATEAELYNLGHNISEATLGDERLTAERLLAHSGDALAIGAGLGFGVSAGGLAIKAAADKAKGALDGLSTFVAEKFPMANPETLNAYAEKNAARVGLEPEDVKAILAKAGTKEGAELRANIGKSEFVSVEERDQTNRLFKQQLEEAREALDGAKRKAFNEARPKEIANLVRDLNPEAASRKAYALADNIKGKLKEMADNPDIYSAKGLVKKLETIEDGYAKRLLAVETPEELFNLVNKTKGLIDKQTKIWGKTIDPAQRETVNAVTELRQQFQSHLTNEELWGAAAARQSHFNDSFNRLATAEKALIGADGKVGAFGVKKITRSGRVEVELSAKKINTFLSQTGAARSELQETALREWLEAAKQFTQQVEHSSSGAEMSFGREGVDSLLDKMSKTAADAEKKLALESKVRQAARLDDIGMNMFPATAAAAMGAVAGSIPGAAAVGLGAKAVGGAVSDAVSARTNPIAMAKTLSRIEAFALGPAKSMARAIDTMIKTAETVGDATVKRELGAAARHMVQSEDDALTRFKRAEKQIRDAQNAGLAQVSAYQAGTAEMSEHAPKTQMALINKQAEVNAFIASKLPTNPFASASTNPKATNWKPSDAQMAAFHRYQQAATNPMTVIQKAMRGAISAEGKEALKTLYPGIYDDVREQLMERVAMPGRSIPRQSAIALSLLFDVPLTPCMQPQVRAAMATQQAPKEQPDKQEEYPTQPRGESKAAKSLRTPEQARMER